MLQTIITTKNLFPQWSELMCSYFEFYNFPINENHLEKVFALILDEKSSLNSFLLYDDEQLVGVTNYSFSPDTFNLINCYLSDLFVKQEFRGNGCASILIDAVKMDAAKHGCHSFYWLTATDNLPAQKLYNKIATKCSWLFYEKSTSI